MKLFFLSTLFVLITGSIYSMQSPIPNINWDGFFPSHSSAKFRVDILEKIVSNFTKFQEKIIHQCNPDIPAHVAESWNFFCDAQHITDNARFFVNALKSHNTCEHCNLSHDPELNANIHAFLNEYKNHEQVYQYRALNLWKKIANSNYDDDIANQLVHLSI